MDCIDRNHKRPVKLYRLEQNKKQRKEDEEEAQTEAAIYAEKMEREGLFINWGEFGFSFHMTFQNRD